MYYDTCVVSANPGGVRGRRGAFRGRTGLEHQEKRTREGRVSLEHERAVGNRGHSVYTARGKETAIDMRDFPWNQRSPFLC